MDAQTVTPYTRGDLKSLALDSYHTNDQINAWIDDLATTYPDIVTALVGGVSYEGREIRGLKISHGAGKKIVFIEGGIHSREWISPATVIYMINELLTSEDEWTKAVAREFDWYIFPVTNPDGYIWTHEEVGVKTIFNLVRHNLYFSHKFSIIKFKQNVWFQFRLWRKNRRPVGNDVGIDLNRNWNSNWMGKVTNLISCININYDYATGLYKTQTK